MPSESRIAVRLTAVLFLLFGVGCEFTGSITNNSSQGDNEYFEEPLSDSSKEFEAALHRSNEAVEALVEGRFSDAHCLLDDELGAHISEERLGQIYSGFYEQFGEFREYLPMQWGFTRLKQDGENVVYSTKIVVHENYRVFYHFKFVNDGRFERISKMNFYSQVDDETVSQAVNRAVSSD